MDNYFFNKEYCEASDCYLTGCDLYLCYLFRQQEQNKDLRRFHKILS